MTSNEKNLFHLRCKQFGTWLHLCGEGNWNRSHSLLALSVTPSTSKPLPDGVTFFFLMSLSLWTDTTVWYPCYHGLWVRSAPPTSSPWIVYPSGLCVCCTGSHWLTRTHESCPDLPRRWYWKYITNKAFENKYIEWESMYFRHISPWAGYNFLPRMTQ